MDEHQTVALSVEAWKKTIDVQQHFNEICMKIRNVYATLLAGLFALIGILETRTEDVMMSAFGYDVHGILFILLGIFGISMMFYFIDRHWYHRLLVGSVLNGMEVEKYLSEKLVGFKLTSTIGDQSALDISKNSLGNWVFFILAKILFAEVTKRDGKHLLRSDAKLAIFYKSVAFLSLIILCTVAYSGGIVAVDKV
jgi:hypothetical protein